MHENTFMAELKVGGMSWYAWDKQHTYLYWKCMKGFTVTSTATEQVLF